MTAFAQKWYFVGLELTDEIFQHGSGLADRGVVGEVNSMVAISVEFTRGFPENVTDRLFNPMLNLDFLGIQVGDTLLHQFLNLLDTLIEFCDVLLDLGERGKGSRMERVRGGHLARCHRIPESPSSALSANG